MHKLESKEEIVFFAGSFNPWHQGHQACIDLLAIDKNLIIIPDHNPFKDDLIENKKFFDIELLENIIQNRSKTYLYDGFFLQNKKNPSYKWIQELRKEFASMKISLLMGFDSFSTILKWTKASLLLKNINIIYIVSRLEINLEIENQKQEVLKVNDKLYIFHLGRHAFEEVSSTKIRSQGK